MRQCSKRARQYMLLYKAVRTIRLDEVEGTETKEVLNKNSILEASIKLYKKLKKTKTSHRSVTEYDIHTLEMELSKEKGKGENIEYLIQSLVKEMISN